MGIYKYIVHETFGISWKILFQNTSSVIFCRDILGNLHILILGSIYMALIKIPHHVSPPFW